jgi:hypothetical protein
MTPIGQALGGRGPPPAAADAGLQVMASAPLHDRSERFRVRDMRLQRIIGDRILAPCQFLVNPWPAE